MGVVGVGVGSARLAIKWAGPARGWRPHLILPSVMPVTANSTRRASSHTGVGMPEAALGAAVVELAVVALAEVAAREVEPPAAETGGGKSPALVVRGGSN